MISLIRSGSKERAPRPRLQEGWVIANHILVSFHVAFISSVLALPAASIFKAEVLRFIFLSQETLVSALFLYLSFHTAVAVHEMGHFLTAARLNALTGASAERVRPRLQQPFLPRLRYYARVFLLAPYGRADGIKREGLNYYPDAPYNLAVAAAGPRASRNLAGAALPPAALLIASGLLLDTAPAIYAGRLLLGIGVVALLDFFLADRGKYDEFQERESRARAAAAAVAAEADASAWYEQAASMKRRMLEQRLQQAAHPRLGLVSAPWQFRNCGMGGRHTEKEYPESNVSMQEAMFVILGASDFQEAQEMTVRLQTRLKEIIEKEPGCRVMGIGLEGGLAPYLERGDFPLPEVRLWSLMRQTIEECGLRPGRDVAIALDPAMSELEIAYRREYNIPDAVGMYLFWRDKTRTVLDRDGVLAVYEQAVRHYDIPILSIEDGFSENDYEGWKKALAALGDRLFIIGDDLVTTNDRTIEMAAGQGMINTALIKANQIGTLYETLVAMLVALGKGLDIVVSHRSKSPNDDMEAHIALAVNALGLKCGGGANTERLIKYQSVAALMRRAPEAEDIPALIAGQQATVRRIWGYEEPTNAGIPTVGAEVEVAVPGAGISLQFRGATPLGTSAGTGEAIHLVDAVIEQAEHREVVAAHLDLLRETEPGVFVFRKGIRDGHLRAAGDKDLAGLYERARRYGGKGCLNAADNVRQRIAPFFAGRDLARACVLEVDRNLLQLELHTARQRGKVGSTCPVDDAVAVMQRKQNLGMNAILSVSLALGRAVAHIRGKQLYEVLREEMMALIGRLAEECGVAIRGSQWNGYLEALRDCNRRFEEEGTSLFSELRRLSGIYITDLSPETRADSDLQEALPVADSEVLAAKPGSRAAVSTAVPTGDSRLALSSLLSAKEQEGLAAVTAELVQAFLRGDESDRREVLRSFLAGAELFSSPSRRFEIVNNRLLRYGGRTLVPYRIEDALLTYVAHNGDAVALPPRRLEPGRILTDALVARWAGLDPAAGPMEVIDLESRLYQFNVREAEELPIARLRDMASLLAAVNACHNIHEADYYLRVLVAGLSGLAFRAFVGAKNLKPEIRRLMDELSRLLNGPHGRRLRFSTRILVRNLSALVLRPNLIDELWNITIDLAEVQIRGSSIINELRRSSHHALGQRTLRLARAYLAYLETGNVRSLSELGFEELAPADLEARRRRAVPEMLRRVVIDLEKLLETSETATRIEQWREAFSESLLRCEFGNSLQEELEILVSDGIRKKNRWIYQHRLRIIRKKAESFDLPNAIAASVRRSLDALEQAGQQAETVDLFAWEADARDCVDGLIRTLRDLHQKELFGELQQIIGSRGDQAFRSFEQICALRHRVSVHMERGGFEELRCHLVQLDCLLEELGYLALRRVAAEFEERGADLELCFYIIRRSIQNLAYDGFAARELEDLGAMLGDPARSPREQANIVDHIKRLYHKVVRRATSPYEAMAERLQLDDADLVALLGNLKRYLHDLNAIVQFCDVVRGQMQSEAGARDRADAAAPASGRKDAILHISHRDEIRSRLEAGTDLREAYGGKGSGLLYISHLGVPTRDGFIVPTSRSRAESGNTDPAAWEREILEHLQDLEHDIAGKGGGEKRFGRTGLPLLLAVRGGSVFSMPGMLSTVVFVGINDRIAAALAELDPWQAYDAYRRFLASYGEAVWRIDMESFGLVEEAKDRHGVRFKHELPWDAMREIAMASKAVLRREGFGEELEVVLEDPRRQLFGAIRAVWASWHSERAQRYREIKDLCSSWHTAVIVQEMAFGNHRNDYVGEGMDETQASLTGVVPHTDITPSGIRTLTGEIKFSAAGDDLVGGLTAAGSLLPISELPRAMPMLNRRLLRIVTTLRRFMGSDQEIEFTIDRGELSVLQTRTAETVEEKKVGSFADRHTPLAVGVGVRGGAFRGLVAFDETGRREMETRLPSMSESADGVLLVLENPTPDDIPLILSADGVLTAKGGSTSHAAVAVNSIEHKAFSAVLGVRGLKVDIGKREAVFLGPDRGVLHRVQPGDVISLHGTTGEVYAGSLPRVG